MTDQVDKLIKDALHARREQRRHEARALLVEALEICREPTPCAKLPLILTWLGAIERELRNGDAALLHYQEAVAIYREQGNTQAIAHSVRHVGDILCEAKRLAEAEVCYDEALALYDNDPQTPPLDFANAIRSLAVLKNDIGERETARLLWTKAKRLYEMVGVEAGVAECSRRLGLPSPK